MSARRESRDEAYDVVVVGSGLGGLTTAALLAKTGKKVLVVERHDRPGGYAHGFKRGKYSFDSAIHVTSGCEEMGFGDLPVIHHVLSVLGVRDRCTFIPLNPFYTAIFPDFRFEAPGGTQEFIEAHIRLFPKEEKGFRQLIRFHTKATREMKLLPPDLSSYDAISSPAKFPLHYEYRDATVSKVMDHYLSDPRLKALFTALWSYQGLPPSRLAFLKWIPMIVCFTHLGVNYCKGGFQNLPNALVEALRNHGGELLLMTGVRRILVEDKKVKGVMLENGQRIAAPLVVSNADGRQTFEELVGFEHLPPAYVADLCKLRPSLSAAVVYMGTNMDLEKAGAAHEMFLFRSWDHDETYREILRDKPAGVTVTIPTLVDPSMAPAGEHVVTVVSLLPYEAAASWRQEKERYADLLVDEVEAVLPGFRKHITFMEGASPRTMERYTLNMSGAIYGWEPSPEQAGINRLGRRTPLEGLWLSGHWTQPGGGVLSVVASGLLTAQVIQGYERTDDFLNSLAHP